MICWHDEDITMKRPLLLRLIVEPSPAQGLEPMRMFLSCVIAICLAGPWMVFATAKVSAADRPPNILIVRADDLGFWDLGFFGGEIRTPDLDALAAGGLRFTQFYNATRCCPSRASLLTGLYPHQAGVGAMTGDQGQPGYRG